MERLTKAIYERAEVSAIVLEHHKKSEGEPPKGYHWEARVVRDGVIVEPVEDADLPLEKR